MSKTENNQLSDATLAMSKAIAGAISRDEGVTDSAKVSKTTFIQTLPEGMTEENVKSVLGHISSYGAAGVDAVGRDGVACMKKNKDLNVVNYTLDLPGRGNEISVQVHRRREKLNPADPSGDPIITHGHVDYKLRLSAGKASSGELGRARQAIRELGKAELG